MKRILHYGLDSKLGGIETYLNKLFLNINRDDYVFDFLVFEGDKPCYYDEFQSLGSKFYFVSQRNSNPIKNYIELERLFKNAEFDALHCHLNTLSYIAPVIFALRRDIPVIVHSRNAGATKSKLTNILHYINSIILPKKKITKLAVSDFAGKWLFGESEDFQVINNGIDIDKYRYNSVSRMNLRQILNVEDQFLVVHLGALRQQKNHTFLLDVFKEIKTLKPQSKLLLVGDGDLKELILNKIQTYGLKNDVIMLGKRDDVPDLLSASDAFLFPSFYEGFPNAVLEAQTSGLPCLISDTITNQVVINENCCSLSLDRSAKDWAITLVAIENMENRINGAKMINNYGFSVNSEVKRIEEIYRKIIENK